MKLNKFHIFYSSLCAVYHCYTITGCNRGVGSSAVYLPVTSCREQGEFGKDLFNTISLKVQYVYTITFNIRSRFSNKITQVMLCYYIHYETVLDDLNICLVVNSIQQRSLHYP